jgi:hypothetical protein
MESSIERTYGPALGWKITEENQPRPPALHVILHKREYILPWSRLLSAEGANAGVVISFATYKIIVTGYGLHHLLADLATERVVSLHEPHRADKFRAAKEPEPKGVITQLDVRRIDDEE